MLGQYHPTHDIRTHQGGWDYCWTCQRELYRPNLSILQYPCLEATVAKPAVILEEAEYNRLKAIEFRYNEVKGLALHVASTSFYWRDNVFVAGPVNALLDRIKAKLYVKGVDE